MLLGACSTAPDIAELAVGLPERTPGPLDEMQALIHGFTWVQDASIQEWEAQVQARHRRSEEIIAACMAEQGFDYIPVPRPGTHLLASEFTPDGIWRGSREFAERYGLGLSTPPTMADIDASWNDQPWHDPNAARLEEMSPAEREAWDIALNGDWTTWGADVDVLDMGCSGLAEHTVMGMPDEQSPFAALEREMNTVRERVYDDPRARDLNAEWAVCMAEAGHGGLHASRGHHSFGHELGDEWDRLNGWGEYQTAEETVPDRAAVAAFREREIALAVADFDCREALDFDARLTEISHEHEQQFVDDHRAELEAFAAHMAERRAG